MNSPFANLGSLGRISVMLALALCVSLTLSLPSAEAQVAIQTNCTVTWNPNSEPDLAGYRVFAVKGAVSKPIVTIPVGPTPSTNCGALAVDSDGIWTINAVAFDTANNASSPAVISLTRDTVPPNTTVTPTITGANASFALASNETMVTFDCKLDAGAWAPCTSPKAYTALVEGNHVFNARATDLAKNVDPTESSHAWTINTSAPAQPSGLTVTPNFP